MGFAEGFDIGPEVVERGGDFPVAGGEMFVQDFSRLDESLIEFEFLDLLRETAVDVFDTEAPGGRMPRLHDVEKMVFGESIPDPETSRRFPCLDPGFVEVDGGIAVDVGEGGEVPEVVGNGVEVFVVLDRSEEGEEVFFELQADELFRTEVAVGFRAGRMLRVPGLGDGLSEEVDPAAIGG